MLGYGGPGAAPIPPAGRPGKVFFSARMFRKSYPPTYLDRMDLPRRGPVQVVLLEASHHLRRPFEEECLSSFASVYNALKPHLGISELMP